MLGRLTTKSLLRRRASRSALVKLSAFKGRGIGRMFVPAPHVWRLFLKFHVSLRRSAWASFLILPITLRLGLTHIRLNSLRAANSSLPVVVLSVAFVSLSSLSLLLVFVPCQSLGLPGAARANGGHADKRDDMTGRTIVKPQCP